MNTRDREIATVVNEQFTRTGMKSGAAAYLSSIKQFAFVHIMAIQKTVSMATWHGAYEKAQSEGKSDADSVTYADSVTRITQSGAGVKDMAAIQQGGELQKALTPFYTYFSVMYNRQADIQLQFSQGGGFKSPKAMMTWMTRNMWMVFMPVLFEGLMRGKLPDDDDEQGWLSWWAAQSFLYAFTGIPVLRDFINGMVTDYGANPAPAYALLDKAAELGSLAMDLATDEKDLGDISTAQLKHVVKTVGQLTHIPVGQAFKTYEWAMKDDPEEPIREFIFGVKRD